MKIVEQRPEMAPYTVMECECGEQFGVDPCDEENLVLLPHPDFGQALFAKCPNCGKVDGTDES